MAAPRTWYHDKYMISTAPQLIQPEAVNAAFGTEEVYWAKPLSPEAIRKLLSNSLCFGLYLLPASSSELAGRSNPAQIGLARLITDETSFAYLTDVYVLKEYQGHGLGSWLMDCVKEELETWPDLRRSMLVTDLKKGTAYYEKSLGMTPFEQGKNGFAVLSKKWAGTTLEV